MYIHYCEVWTTPCLKNWCNGAVLFYAHKVFSEMLVSSFLILTFPLPLRAHTWPGEESPSPTKPYTQADPDTPSGRSWTISKVLYVKDKLPRYQHACRPRKWSATTLARRQATSWLGLTRSSVQKALNWSRASLAWFKGGCKRPSTTVHGGMQYFHC